MWKLYHNWIVSRKIRSHWILKEAYSLGKTWCQKSWDQFDEYGSHSLRYVKQVSGKTKDHRSEKYKSKFLISEVPTLWNLRTAAKSLRYEIWGQISTRDWKTTAMRRNIYKLKKKQSYILLALGRMGIAGCINKRAGRKKVCGRFQS